MKKIVKEDYKNNAGPLQDPNLRGSDGQPIKFTNVAQLPDDIARNWNEIALSRKSFQELLTYAEKYIQIDNKLKQSLETQFQGDERAKTRAKSRLISRLTTTPGRAASKIAAYRQRQQQDPEVAQDAQPQSDDESDIVSFRDIFQTVPEDERRNFQSQLDINIALGDALGTSGLKIDSDSVNANLLKAALLAVFKTNTVDRLMAQINNKTLVQENLSLNNASSKDMTKLEEMLHDFYPYAKKRLGFDKPVGVNLVSDPKNAKNPFGKTAYYNPQDMEITIFVDGRHVKDILRSFSHELVHHTQNCRGDLNHSNDNAPGYAQRDPHMRKMEGEAYLLGNGFLVRDYEDQLKEKKTMKEDMIREAVTQIIEKLTAEGKVPPQLAPFVKKAKDKAKDKPAKAKKAGGSKPDFLDLDKDGDKEESMKSAAADAKVKKEEIDENEEINEEEVEERVKKDLPDRVQGREAGRRLKVAESVEYKKSNASKKEQLLYERLKNMWAK